MDNLTDFMPYILQAAGGAVGGNILGALTRGGGGLVGRTILGAIGGVGAAYGAGMFPEQTQVVTGLWAALPVGDAATQVHAANGITGAAGGGIVGLITGLLIRPRD